MIDFKTNIALYQQVAMYFEQKIRSRELVAGDRLPTTMELSKQLGVNRETIQLGLKLLMNQGLISRAPKRGTFVQEYAHRKVLGLVFPQDIYADSDVIFFPVYFSCLAKYASTFGWQARYFITSPNDQIDNGFYDLRKDIEAGDLGGIASVSSENTAVGAYLTRECPIPKIVNPDIDFKQMIELGLDRLRKSSYTLIDVFFPIRHDDALASRHEAELILDHYCKTRKIDHQLLRLHIVPAHYNEVRRIFTQIWEKQSPHPEAILIAVDALFHGIWNAILELKIDVPGELGLITHTNKRLIPRTHIPLTALEISTDEMAQIAFDAFLDKLDGKRISTFNVTSSLVEGKTCRPPGTTATR